MMKIRLIYMLISMSLILGCGQTSNSNSKKTYYINEKEEIITQTQYDEKKKGIINGFKEKGVNVKIEESFSLAKENQDSIIKEYTFKIITLNSKDEIEKEPNTGKHLLGKKLPDAVLKSLDGSDMKLSDLTGKPTMINFWFTNCKPCIDEFPILNNLQKKYADKVNFVSITFDDEEKVRKLIQKFPFNFLSLINANDYIEELGIEAFPTSLFIDKNGVVQKTEGTIPFIIEGGKKKMEDGKSFEMILNNLL